MCRPVRCLTSSLLILFLCTACTEESRVRTDDSAEASEPTSDGAEDQPTQAEPATPDPSPPLAPARDSGGVRIVELSGDLRALPPAYRVKPDPVADFGGARTPADELQGTGYRRIVRVGDGRVVVADDYKLKFFDRDGTLVHTSGRRGSGPGEFARQISELCIAAGDSIVAIDGGLRGSVLDLQGTFVRAFVLSRSMFANEACAGFPSWLNMTDRTDPADRSLHRVSIARVSPDGVSDEPLLSLTYSDQPMSMIGPGAMAQSFFSTTFNLVPFADRLYVGHGGMPEVRIYDLGGSLRDIVRWSPTPVALTERVAECMIRNGMVIPPGSDPVLVDRFVAARLADPRPEHPSSFGRIKVDDEGRIWIQDPYFLYGTPPGWTVLDSDGRPVGQVAIPVPAGADPQSIDVVAIWRAELVLEWKEAELGFQTPDRPCA